MHILYVDESGDDGFSPSDTYLPNKTPTRYFIRVGLIVHDWKWKRINEAVNEFRYRHKIPQSIELHATEIVNGNSRTYKKGTKGTTFNWYGLTFPDKKDRLALLSDACSLVCSLDTTIIVVAIDKSLIKTTHPDYRKMPKAKSWEMLIERYHLFLRHATDTKGIIISDAIENTLEKEHREFAKGLFSTSAHLDDYHFVESILFEPSESSNLLQLADIVSYSFQRKFNLGDASLSTCLEPKLLCHNGDSDGHGLKIWPPQP